MSLLHKIEIIIIPERWLLGLDKIIHRQCLAQWEHSNRRVDSQHFKNLIMLIYHFNNYLWLTYFLARILKLRCQAYSHYYYLYCWNHQLTQFLLNTSSVSFWSHCGLFSWGLTILHCGRQLQRLTWAGSHRNANTCIWKRKIASYIVKGNLEHLASNLCDWIFLIGLNPIDLSKEQYEERWISAET